MCGENALKEVMGKVLQKVQVGVGEDENDVGSRVSAVAGGYLCACTYASKLPSCLTYWRALHTIYIL